MAKPTDIFMGLKSNELFGGLIYAGAEPFIDQFTSGMAGNLPVLGNVGDDAVKLGLGLLGRKFLKNPLAKGIATSMIHVNLYKVSKTYMPNLTGAVSGTGSGFENFG